MVMEYHKPYNFSKGEIAIEEFKVLLHQESSRYLNNYKYLFVAKRGKYDRPQPPNTIIVSRDNYKTNHQVNESWRRKICEWAFSVVDEFGFDREVVSIALYFLDRVVALKGCAPLTSVTEEEKDDAIQLKASEFQLIAITCLYIAIKVHGETDSFDGRRCKLRIEVFVKLSRGLVTAKKLEAKEVEILQILQWNVNPPTTARFIVSLLQLLKGESIHSKVFQSCYEIARYLSEVSVCVSTISLQYKQSEVAYACILCAFDIFKGKHVQNMKIKFLEIVSYWTKTTLTPSTVAPIRTLLIKRCPEIFSQKS